LNRAKKPGCKIGGVWKDTASGAKDHRAERKEADGPRARLKARTLKLLDCSPISCFNFDMEILSFGIDCAPFRAKTLQVTRSAYRSISSRPPHFPRS
jgi:hypothetical protein